MSGLTDQVNMTLIVVTGMLNSKPIKWRFDHDIISMVIHLLQLIQEGKLSVIGKSMCTNTD